MYYQHWDRSHYLENLSGYETKCSMVTRNSWDFSTSKALANQRDMTIDGKFGYAQNQGDTTDAMMTVLEQWKQVINHIEVV